MAEGTVTINVIANIDDIKKKAKDIQKLLTPGIVSAVAGARPKGDVAGVEQIFKKLKIADLSAAVNATGKFNTAIKTTTQSMVAGIGQLRVGGITGLMVRRGIMAAEAAAPKAEIPGVEFMPAAEAAGAGTAAAGAAEATGTAAAAGIAGTISTVVSALAPLALILAAIIAIAAIAQFIGAIIQEGFSLSARMIGNVVKVLSLILKPLDIVITGLLAALIAILMPFIRMWMRIFMPASMAFNKTLMTEIRKGTSAPVAVGKAAVAAGATLFGPLLEGIIDALAALAKQLVDALVTPIQLVILTLGALGSILLALGGPITEGLREGFEGLIAKMLMGAEVLKTGWFVGIDLAAEGLKGFVGAISDLMDPLKETPPVMNEAKAVYSSFGSDLILGITDSLGQAGIFSKDFPEILRKGFTAVQSIMELFKLQIQLTGTVADKATNPVVLLGDAFDAVAKKAVEAKRTLDNIIAEARGAKERLIAEAAQPKMTPEEGIRMAIEAAKKGREEYLRGEVAAAPSPPPVPPTPPRFEFNEAIMGAAKMFGTEWMLPKQMGGLIGETGPYMLHAGERVTPAGGAAGTAPNITNNITVNAEISNDIDVRDLADKLSRYMHVELNKRVSYGARVV